MSTSTEESRREFMRKAGAAGVSIGSVSIAGCSGDSGDGGGDGGDGDDGETTRNVEEDLPEDRRIGELVHLSNTERYWPERYQANQFVDEHLRERLGVNAQTEPLEISTMASRYNTANPPEEPADGDFWTHNWCASMGDPDSIIYDRFHADGSLNYNGFDHESYNEVAAEQRVTVDADERQELIYEAQKIFGEQRPESQYLYNLYPYAVNTNEIKPDSVVITTGPNNILNWTSMEPANGADDVAVTNNWDPTDSMNPLNTNTVGPSRNQIPMRFIHDFLVRLDENLGSIPWAAEEWEWINQTTNVVTLRDGMTFHDGEDVTVEDIIFTVELIMDTEPPSFVPIVNDVLDGVERTGDREITFNLSEPFAPFVSNTLGQLPILPQHYWEQILDETGSESEPWSITFNDDRPVIGSGPFQYGSWTQGERFNMPAFDDHFEAPNISERIQRPLATRDAELEAIRSGEYDILDYWFGSPSRLEEEANNTEHLELVTSKDDCRQRMQKNCAKPPNDDPAFRQAINAVVMAAQPTIIEEIYGGFGEESISPVNPLLEFWHNPDTPFFNGVETAEKILSDAGYAWDQDGNLYYPEGKTGE